jgi:hypothetical protein
MLLNIHIYAVFEHCSHVIHENKVCNVACNLMVKWCDVRMFTTEIWEGFDVQMTQDMNETVEKYGELTHAIMSHYLLEFGKLNTPPMQFVQLLGSLWNTARILIWNRSAMCLGFSSCK